MTPKEKAEELVDKMRNINTKDYQLGEMYFIVPKQIAILQALITVDEVIEQWEYIGSHPTDGELIYWKKVKQEVKKLNKK